MNQKKTFSKIVAKHISLDKPLVIPEITVSEKINKGFETPPIDYSGIEYCKTTQIGERKNINDLNIIMYVK